MKWLRNAFPTTIRTVADNGQVMEWHVAFPINYGKLVSEPALKPMVEESKTHELSEGAELSTPQHKRRQNVRQRWRNLLRASPIYTTAIVFFLLPFDLWLPILLNYICHDPATVPEPKSHPFLTALLTLSTTLLFTIVSCLAFYRHDISFAEPITGLLSFINTPLFAIELVGETTRFRWPLIIWAAGVAGWANALFLRKTIDAFGSGTFSTLPPQDQGPPRRKAKQVLVFIARLVMKVIPTLFITVEYLHPSSSKFSYLLPIDVKKAAELLALLYLFHIICCITTQTFGTYLIPRADCGPLYMIVDHEDWAMEMRVGSGTDPGPIDLAEGRKAENVTVLQVSLILSVSFCGGWFLWLVWECFKLVLGRFFI